jgi:fatty acid desaturase
VAIGAATVTILKLPWTAILLAAFLTTSGGFGTTPLIVVGVAVAYATAVAVARKLDAPLSDNTHSPVTPAGETA